MTELRDARLKRALDHAPDALLRPDRATREAIRNIAAQAAMTPDPVPPKAPSGAFGWVRARARLWWNRPRTPSTRMPWNAVLASVLLASLVMVMWYEQPVPQATPDDAPAPAPAHESGRDTSAPKQQAQGAADALAKGDRVARQVAPEPAMAVGKVESRPRRGSDGPGKNLQRNARLELPATPQAEPATVAPHQSDSASTALAPAPAPAAKTMSEQAAIRSPELVNEKREASVGAALTTRAQAPRLRADWSDVSIQRAGTASALSASQAGRLVVVLQAVGLRNIEPGDPPLSEAIRLELSRRGVVVGALELGDRWLRWTPVGADPGSVLTGRASVSQWEAIQDELARMGLLAP
ncbi:hypothetical protein [Rhodoferax sp.]|uniref:hypothetical protein n=1 Tax=Rhodoferax sp. TaxID=50421 RepID=UPI002746F044|nr:hypothetical protein [Rhodoferax sp.]